MALEVATLVSDLVITNPTAGDPAAQGDDHLRLLKSVLQNQFPDADNGAIYGMRAAAAQATTSGTSVDFTSIPDWVKRVTVNFNAVSLSGNSVPMIQLGTSGGVQVTAYSGSGVSLGNTNIVTATSNASGFLIGGDGASSTALHGSVTLCLIDAATGIWAASGVMGRTGSAAGAFAGGTKTLSGTLDRIRITSLNGTDTFDAGSVNILYE